MVDPDFFQVEGLLLVLLSIHDANVDQVVEGHCGFVSRCRLLDLAGLHCECDLVLMVGRFGVGCRDCLVVVEDDVFEGVGDVVLELRGRLSSEGVDELAGVWIGGRTGCRWALA